MTRIHTKMLKTADVMCLLTTIKFKLSFYFVILGDDAIRYSILNNVLQEILKNSVFN